MFRSLRHHLSKKHFDDQDHLKLHFETCFQSNCKKFYEDDIMDLSKRWEYIVDNHSAYITERSSFASINF